jgi:hypothetical protein
MPRRGSDQLTGGTRDVSPQWFTLPTAQTSVANTFTELLTPIPVQRFNNKSGSSLVMEVLKAEVNFPEADAANSIAGNSVSALIQLGTIAQAVVSPANPQNIFYAARIWRGAFTAGGSFLSVHDNPLQFDLTDGAGHGVLVATDQIYIDVNTVGFAGTAGFNIRLLYRWKSVSLAEYIGIVQSQQ